MADPSTSRKTKPSWPLDRSARSLSGMVGLLRARKPLDVELVLRKAR